MNGWTDRSNRGQSLKGATFGFILFVKQFSLYPIHTFDPAGDMLLPLRNSGLIHSNSSQVRSQVSAFHVRHGINPYKYEMNE